MKRIIIYDSDEEFELLAAIVNRLHLARDNKVPNAEKRLPILERLFESLLKQLYPRAEHTTLSDK